MIWTNERSAGGIEGRMWTVVKIDKRVQGGGLLVEGEITNGKKGSGKKVKIYTMKKLFFQSMGSGGRRREWQNGKKVTEIEKHKHRIIGVLMTFLVTETKTEKDPTPIKPSDRRPY